MNGKHNRYNIDFDMASFRFEKRLTQSTLGDSIGISQGLVSYCDRHGKVSNAILTKMKSVFGNDIVNRYCNIAQTKEASLEQLCNAIRDKGFDVKIVLTK